MKKNKSLLIAVFIGYAATMHPAFQDIADLVTQVQAALSTKEALSAAKIKEIRSLIQQGQDQFQLQDTDPRIKFFLKELEGLSKIVDLKTQFQKGMTIEQMLTAVSQLSLISPPDYSTAVHTQAVDLLYKILEHIFNSLRKDLAEISIGELQMLARKIDKILQTPDLATKNKNVFTELTKALTSINNFIDQQTAEPAEYRPPLRVAEEAKYQLYVPEEGSAQIGTVTISPGQPIYKPTITERPAITLPGKQPITSSNAGRTPTPVFTEETAVPSPVPLTPETGALVPYIDVTKPRPVVTPGVYDEYEDVERIIQVGTKPGAQPYTATVTPATQEQLKAELRRLQIRVNWLKASMPQ